LSQGWCEIISHLCCRKSSINQSVVFAPQRASVAL